MHGRRVGDARRHQFHGHARARPDLPDADARAAATSSSCGRWCRNNETPYGTAFTVSIEAREGIATGISAADRAHTIRVAVDPDEGRARPRSSRATCSRCAPVRAACSSAPARPRPPSTSPASPGCTPAGVICEVMNEDGTMARVPDLRVFCAEHGIALITVADLIDYRRRTEKLVERMAGRQPADRVRRLPGRRLRVEDRRQAPPGAGLRRRRRPARRARARPLGVPHRRRLPLAALRLRRAARPGAAPDRRTRAAACCCTWRRRAAASAC